ncbi:MAG: peroxidase-related enzyme [Rhodospirillaceae bacterium]|jgi:uncharacterized peroxidase-related enzyme
MTSKPERETPEQLPQISKLPIPDVETLPEDLQKYIRVCDEKLGYVPNVVLSYTFRPEKLRTFIAKYDEMMLKDEHTTLTRLEREMIAVVVSSYNHCLYCITSHGQAVREFSGDPVLGDILATNYREANLSERHRAILDFAWDMTAHPAETTDEHRQKLYDAGLTAEEIFDVADVIAYFNYTNRMALATGMAPNRIYFGMDRLKPE